MPNKCRVHLKINFACKYSIKNYAEMAKRVGQTAVTPKCNSLKQVNTKSVLISRNKKTQGKSKTQKGKGNEPQEGNIGSPTTNINSKRHPQRRNCVLKLKRFKMPPLALDLDHLCDVSSAPNQISKNTSSSTKKCRVRLSRVHDNAKQDTMVQKSKNHKSPMRTHRLRNDKNKENDENSGVNGNIQEQASTVKPSCEKQNDNENNQSSFKPVDVAIKSSTPFKTFAAFQREPFKALNMQENVRQVVPEEHASKKQPLITKENRECMRKLSLSRSKNPQTLRTKNKIVRFEPLRNSTFYAVDTPSNTTNAMDTSTKNVLLSSRLCDTDLEPEKADDDKSTENSLEKSQSSFKNFANRSDLIEQLLLSDNEEEEIVVNQQPPPNETTVANKTNKFFHRTLENSKNTNNTIIKKINAVEKTTSGKRRLTQRGKFSAGSVYEYLSQSQNSDSDTATKKFDPAADVIKKLIAEGKVRVATRKKGIGKLTIKRKIISKKRAVVQRKKINKQNIQKVAQKIYKEPYADNDDMQNVAFEGPEIPDQPVQLAEEAVNLPSSRKNHDTSAVGDTFSDLARSVLLSETKKKENSRKKVKITNQRKLLEVAQKFVSTPVRKVYPALSKTSNMSPIMLEVDPLPEDHGGASPWRVNDDAHLPSVFFFSRNSANLPSFSSDYIPSSPRKQKHRYQDLLPEPESELPVPATPFNHFDDAHLPIIPTTGVEHSKPSDSLSSFSSNDSNAENKAPPSSETNPNTPEAENLNLITERQQLNPRRELSHRSPLQILNIISLPPWNSSKQQDMVERKDQKASNNSTTLSNHQTKGNISDLFGFEEFITDDTTEDEHHVPVEDIEKSNNSSFRNKLHDLKHLRPAQKEHPQPSSSNRIADVFDIGAGQSGGKQLNIKPMLSSTMINYGKDKEVKPKSRNKINKRSAGAEKRTNELSELFLDPDPGTSFNEKDYLRTYVRPYKRKRKLRHDFVMFLDSDESCDDDEAHQKDHSETSKELEVKNKNKKHKKDNKDNVELNSFMNEFNSMCKEVDKYELIIE